MLSGELSLVKFGYHEDAVLVCSIFNLLFERMRMCLCKDLPAIGVSEVFVSSPNGMRTMISALR